MELEAILITILKISGTGFVMFLLGYLGYTIVRRGKLNHIRRQHKFERAESERMEDYIKSIDNDLRREIDSAVRVSKRNQQNTQTTEPSQQWNEKDMYDGFTIQLKERLHNILDKGFKYIAQGEQQYQKYNSKYHFDEGDVFIEKIKNKLTNELDKIIETVDKKISRK